MKRQKYFILSHPFTATKSLTRKPYSPHFALPPPLPTSCHLVISESTWIMGLNRKMLSDNH